ncbi:hypothetical protein MLD38_010621 [Melastoma candidum]|uniref:Uncharacterized protein n=1 Tax=Melastoma candidum TaxID=119954 RepID=A0ACB9R0H0_9MYRT|nr:hypothetical protein MLD38_010621 [Melastoma candidum]
MNIFPRHFPIPTEPMTSSDSFPMSLFAETAISHIAPDVGPLLMEFEKPMALEHAISSLDELVKIFRARDPLWVANDAEGGRETLDFKEHSRLFPCPDLSTKDSSEISGEFRREASRDSAMVIMNSINLVDAFLDANKWRELFPSIVARAKTIQVITSGD